MKNKVSLASTRCILRISLCICMLFAFAGTSKAVNKDYILILNSYNESSAWSSSITSSVLNHISKIDYTDVYVEHLNLSMAGSSFKLEQLTDILLSKYGKTPPKALIIIGSMGLIFRDNINNIWGKVPIIVCGDRPYVYPEQFYRNTGKLDFTGRTEIKSLSEDYNLTFLHTPVYLEENVELMIKVIPGMKRLIFLGDNIYPNPVYDMTLREFISNNHPDIEYQYLSSSDNEMHQLYDKLRSLDNTTGILVSTWFTETIASNGMMINTMRSISSISNPLFTIRYAGTNDGGMVGGYVYDEKEYGEQLVNTIDEILGGKKASDIPFYEPKKSYPKMSINRMQQKGLNPGNCPDNTVFYDKEDTFLTKYKWFILAALAVCLIVLLSQQRRIKILKNYRLLQQREIEAHKKYTDILNNMPILFMKVRAIRDEEGKIVDIMYLDMNTYFENNFHSKDDILGKKATEIFPSTTTDFVYFIDIVIREQRSITFPYYYKEMNIFFDVVLNNSLNEKDVVNIFSLNSTDLHNAQKLLSETNRKLALALEAANIIPWKWDLKEHKITCDIKKSATAAALPGDISESILTVSEEQYFSKIKKEDRQRVINAYKALAEGRTDKVKEEYRVVAHDGKSWTTDWIEAQAVVESRDENNTPQMLVGSSLVITKRKEMEMELMSAKNRAEESNRLKSAFLANMSHEIRTPLNAIVGFSNILASVEEESEKEEYIGIIESNNTLLLQLINDILDLSKIEAGTMEFISKPVNLTDLVNEMKNTIQYRIDSDNISLSVHVPQQPCIIDIDRSRLMQVVMNMLTNAVKFTTQGSISFGYENRGDTLYFFVSDTGCGIPADKKDSVFERFVKLNNFAQGTGLGLSICQTIVEHFNGKIGVDSEEGKGSTFWFTIPYIPARLDDKPSEAVVPIQVQRDKITILIAEDNDSNYKLFNSILKKEYNLIHAWDGQEAVRLYSIHKPQIILMDINMPVMDGYEATREIRKLSSSVPIIAVTAFAYASDEQKVMDSGFDGYMSKPINAPKLRQQIAAVLKQRIILL